MFVGPPPLPSEQVELLTCPLLHRVGGTSGQAGLRRHFVLGYLGSNDRALLIV
jgi:hypothetical protein